MQGRAALGLIDPPGEKDHQQRQYRNAPFFQQGADNGAGRSPVSK